MIGRFMWPDGTIGEYHLECSYQWVSMYLYRLQGPNIGLHEPIPMPVIDGINVAKVVWRKTTDGSNGPWYEPASDLPPWWQEATNRSS